MADDELRPISKPPELVCTIGKGSFGVVWRAKDEHGRTVAVKIVPLVQAAAAVEEELDQEVELMRRFCHPNLVQFHTAFRIAEAREVWVVMELCEAGPLPLSPDPEPAGCIPQDTTRPSLNPEQAGSLLIVIRQHGPLVAEEVCAVSYEVLVALRRTAARSTVPRHPSAARHPATNRAPVHTSSVGLHYAVYCGHALRGALCRYLHVEQSTVHRDVKAANVLLTADAQVRPQPGASPAPARAWRVHGTCMACVWHAHGVCIACAWCARGNTHTPCR